MLDFLMSATLEDVAEHVPARKGGAKKERNPQGLAIRLFRDGSVYPSQELTDKFAMEYAGKDAEHGYGLDVVDTDLYPAFKAGRRLILVSPVKKSAGKVDLFGVTTYDEQGQPKVSVMEQGAKTFGKEDLIPMVQEIFGIVFAQPEVKKDDAVVTPAVEGVEYVDLHLVANPATGEPWTTPKEVTFLPKKVSRGEAKGSVSTVRRESVKFYALLPASFIEQSEQPKAQQPEDQPVAEAVVAPALDEEVAASPFA